MFEEMAVLVDAQGEMLDAIEELCPCVVFRRLHLQCAAGSRQQHQGVHCQSRAGHATSQQGNGRDGASVIFLGVDKDKEGTDAGPRACIILCHQHEFPCSAFP